MTHRKVLYKKIYKDLRARILSGEYRPGDAIPTEHELMNQFGVSRITTNRALKMLADEGLIVRKVGLGTFVSNSVSSSASRDNEHSGQPAARLVGFVLPFLHSFGPRLLAALERHLRDHDICLAIACSEGSQDIEAYCIDRLVEIGAKGLIIMPVNGEYYNHSILKLHTLGFPIVLVDKRLPGIPVPSVCTDNVEASRRLTEHLLSLGHRQIAFFSPKIKGTSTLEDRFKGFSMALNQAGIEVNPSYCIEASLPDYRLEELDKNQLSTICEFMRKTEVSAVFATDDYLALYWYEAARCLGRQIPDDFAIVCFDAYRPHYYYHLESFTSAIQDEQSIAAEAVRLLLSLLQNDNVEVSNVLVKAKIVVGASTKRIDHSVVFN